MKTLAKSLTFLAGLALAAGTAYAAGDPPQAGPGAPPPPPGCPCMQQGMGPGCGMAPGRGMGPGMQGKMGRRHGMRGDHGFGFGPWMARELNLTADQQTKIKGIADAHKDALEKAAKGAADAREALRLKVHDPAASEDAVRAAATAAAQAKVQLAVERHKMLVEINGALTPEQQKQLQDLRAKMQERRDQRRPGMRPRADVEM